jgi:putative sigma-54 modulation protein
MATEISGRNFDITPDIREMLETKLAKIEERLFNDVVEVRVVLDVQKYRNICEVMIIGKDYDVKAIQESDASMHDAINATLDHIKRQAQKNHERMKDHHKNDATRFVDAGDRVDDAGPRDVVGAEAAGEPVRDRNVADTTAFDADGKVAR